MGGRGADIKVPVSGLWGGVGKGGREGGRHQGTSVLTLGWGLVRVGGRGADIKVPVS